MTKVDKDKGQTIALLGRLQVACANDTPASLRAAHMSLSCAGRLHSASAAGLIVELPNPPTDDVALIGSAVALSFPVGAKIASFASEITEAQSGRDGSILATLHLPDALQVDDRRAAVRIPVPRGALNATILRDDRREAVRAIDISLTGILIELGGTQPASVEVGGSLTVGLTLGEHDLVVETKVCRRDARRFGLQYVSNGGPPRKLARVIYEIQKARRPTR